MRRRGGASVRRRDGKHGFELGAPGVQREGACGVGRRGGGGPRVQLHALRELDHAIGRGGSEGGGVCVGVDAQLAARDGPHLQRLRKLAQRAVPVVRLRRRHAPPLHQMRALAPLRPQNTKCARVFVAHYSSSLQFPQAMLLLLLLLLVLLMMLLLRWMRSLMLLLRLRLWVKMPHEELVLALNEIRAWLHCGKDENYVRVREANDG
mmetsp:Transcript_12322/g.33272  ORF Transcript_12322/g.33272 Transcript_12322/m.33272 type:complete len:207 (-) Transcript_12322:477-1097(-)